MKRWIRIILPITVIALSVGILAQSDEFLLDDNYFGSQLSSWFVGVGAGFENLFFQNRTNFLVTGTIPPPDQYSLYNSRNTNGMFSVFVGHQWRPVTNGRINLFLEYDDFGSSSATGTRFAFSFNNPTNLFYSPSPYSYSLSHQALLFGAKVNFAEWHQLMPYVEGGVGVSRNEFSNFSNNVTNLANPIFNQTTPTNPFPNNVNYDIAFIVGLGVDILLQHNWLLSFGYRYGSWGDVNSGNMTSLPPPPIGFGGLISPIHLTNEIYSNQAMVKMSYSFAG